MSVLLFKKLKLVFFRFLLCDLLFNTCYLPFYIDLFPNLDGLPILFPPLIHSSYSLLIVDHAEAPERIFVCSPVPVVSSRRSVIPCLFANIPGKTVIPLYTTDYLRLFKLLLGNQILNCAPVLQFAGCKKFIVFS